MGCGPVPSRQPFDQAMVDAFGRRVRALRLAASLTQEGLAEAAGLHPTFISNLERGYRSPTLGTMVRLARGLAVDLGQLVGGLEQDAEG